MIAALLAAVTLPAFNPDMATTSVMRFCSQAGLASDKAVVASRQARQVVDQLKDGFPANLYIVMRQQTTSVADNQKRLDAIVQAFCGFSPLSDEPHIHP